MWELVVVEHVLVAPDKFKGSLAAAEVAARVSAGLGVPAIELPVADGGDGTVDAVVACGFSRITIEVTGPTGSPVQASYAWHPTGAPTRAPSDGHAGAHTCVPPDRHARADTRVPPDGHAGAASGSPAAGRGRPTAVIEMAEASGLRRLPSGLEPLTATSRGTGELIADALGRGAERIVLGLGGSACTDGGAGMAQALG
ncbi:glycerate kinase, partial [Nonomuraea lactucae]|uniref:glycerate kinase n=1 Tax=Nonomuraea lactucae TaxID=2249762 RepID=UPI001F06FD64